MSETIENRVRDVQRQFDAHADLNDEPREVEAFAVGDAVHWRGPHKLTGKMVTGTWGDVGR